MTDHPTAPTDAVDDGGSAVPEPAASPERGPDVASGAGADRSRRAPTWLDDPGPEDTGPSEAPTAPGTSAGAADTRDIAPVDGAAAVPPDATPDEPSGESIGDHEDGEDAEEPSWEDLAAADERTRGELLAALHATTTARDEYLDGLQRKQAEFENFRRRMQQQAAQQRVAGHADVAGRVLEVLDDFDRTVDSIATTADEGVVRGVSLVRDKLLGVLREVGLERVDDAGARFDPTRHEAVQQVPGDGIVGEDGEPVVVEVLRPGYVLGSRVLRAAMVAVAQ